LSDKRLSRSNSKEGLRYFSLAFDIRLKRKIIVISSHDEQRRS